MQVISKKIDEADRVDEQDKLAAFLNGIADAINDLADIASVNDNNNYRTSKMTLACGQLDEYLHQFINGWIRALPEGQQKHIIKLLTEATDAPSTALAHDLSQRISESNIAVLLRIAGRFKAMGAGAIVD